MQCVTKINEFNVTNRDLCDCLKQTVGSVCSINLKGTDNPVLWHNLCFAALKWQKTRINATLYITVERRDFLQYGLYCHLKNKQ